MALNVINGAVGQVIKNAGSWYAYDTNSVFLANDSATPTTPETFIVTLGATQDDVTHIDSLPMRADLQSVTGDGSNLTFSITVQQGVAMGRPSFLYGGATKARGHVQSVTVGGNVAFVGGGHLDVPEAS